MTGTGEAHEGGATVNTVSGGVFFHTVVQGRDITVQLPPAITPALSGLPPRAPAFTGRDRHVEQLLADLAPRPAPVLDDDGGGAPQRAVLVSAVSGLGGIGKTELAVQTAALALRQPGWFPGGVLFTDLAGYDPERRLSPERALEGLLRALAVPGEHIPHSLEDRQRLYRSVLAAYAAEGRRVLVVIDNASTTDQAAPLLPADGITAALVTSRHTLDGLDARLHDLDTLDESAATDLLDLAVRHARGSDDTRISDDPASAVLIARLCAGLPLALRIAAATLAATPTRPAASLATALRAEHSRLDKLARLDRAVRAAFDLSYRILPDDQARLFRLLPLNPGPVLSTEAAAHLADGTPDQVEELLRHLADAHLIELGTIWGRWRMHDLVRLHATEHGLARAAPDQRDAARARLFAHYEDTAEAAGTHLVHPFGPPTEHFPDRVAALAWLDAERDNLIATATVAPELGHAATAPRLVLSIAPYLDDRRYFDDWVTLAQAALSICRDRGDRDNEGGLLNSLGNALWKVRRFEEAIDTYVECLAIWREVEDRAGEAQTLNNLGIVLNEVRQFDKAVETHTQSLTIWRSLDDRHGEAEALDSLGTNFGASGRLEEAVDAHTRAAVIFRELRDRHSEARVLDNRGSSLQAVERFEEAIEAHTGAVTLFRELRDRHREAWARDNRALALQAVGRVEEAVDAHTRAAATFRELGDRHSEGRALDNLGTALGGAKRFEQAVDVHTQAVTLFRELGDRHLEGQALGNLGTSLIALDRPEAAIDAHTRELAVRQEAGDRYGEAWALLNLGVALGETERLEEAIDHLTQSVAAFREVHDRPAEGRALFGLGFAQYEAGRFEEAIKAFTPAVTVFREHGDRSNEGSALGNTGLALNDLGRFEEAMSVFGQAVTIFRELGKQEEAEELMSYWAIARDSAG
ncbi:tetratricopeptide repeat protein [Streptomyces sp. NPDC090135]|uniref:tetratricopeptide repeat protein n=1 Tax=Streptomyces sp. NPDC090135 TaxID=3365957 RepID=UPI00382FB44D